MARNVLIDLIGRDRASPAFERAAASATAAAGKMSAANARMAKTGATLTRGVTVPLLAVAAVSTKVAMDYQKSMTLLQTAGGESAKKTAIISKGIQDVAIKTGTSLKDLTEGMYTVAKAGSQKWSAAGQLKVLQAAAEGAKSEDVDLGTATNALTSVMMSYHLGTSQAVKTQNMLVVGAGRAKTTMQEYAAALSTVVPVASAAHISFAQVAGAIATMTQHGTSADEATQELSHTIRNLTSPNQVAQKAMGQLNLSVEDVTKNLGKRGLTGTIDLITNAIAKYMGPAGMVAVSAFKQSQSASADLSIELAKMPKHLADISHEFASGKMSYKDYYKAVKDLGGQAFLLGKGFLSTFQQAHGFNDLLKSGSPAARTFAGTLKNVMGTATGMNTALQLGGENLTYFKTAADDVAAAARRSGSDVLGWSKTSQTLQVKMDQAKASLQVLALEIGNALIPAVSKIVGWVRQAVEWFTNLSGTQKAILGWSLAFMAALGPILGIGARLATVASGIGRFVGGVGSMLGRLAGATEVTRGRISTAMRGMSSALAGAAIGYTVGQFTKNASTTTKWLATLGSTAAGAAIGFSMGGPIGAALGGIAGGVSSLATNFLKVGDNASASSKVAQQGLAIQNDAASNLLATLKSVNGAYQATTRQAVATQLQKTPINGKGSPNVLSAASSLGVSPADLTKAALGSDAALGRIQDRLLNIKGAASDMAMQTLLALSNIVQGSGKAEQSWEQYNAAVGNSLVTAKLYKQGAAGLVKELQGTGTSINDISAFGIRNTAVIRANVGMINKQAQAQLAQGKSVRSVTTWMQGQVGALQLTTNNLGFNADAVQNLVNKYKMTPKQIITKLIADSRPGQSTVARFKTLINNIRQGKIPGLTADSAAGKSVIADLTGRINSIRQGNVPTLSVNTGNAISQIDAVNRYLNGLQSRTIYVNVAHRVLGAPVPIATGGMIRGPGTGTSDSIPARLSNGEYVIRASQARKHMGLLNRINTPGFATGGKVDTSKIGSAIGTIGQAYTKPLDVASVGMTLIRAQIANALAVLNQQIHNGLSAAASSSFRAEISSLTAEANKQLSELKLHIKNSDFSAFRNALTSTVSDASTALGKLLTDVYHAGGGTSVIAKVRSEEGKLFALQKQRLAVTTQLTDVQQKWNDTFQAAKTATMGSFDITTAGPGQVYNDQPGGNSIGGILGSVRAALANAGKFASVLRQLAAGGLNPALVSQIAAAGPGALAQAQALLAATPAQLNSLNWNYSHLTTTAKYIGSVSADAMYNAGGGMAQGLLEGLQSKQSALYGQMKTLADGMVAALKKSLGIHSPSRVMRGLAHHTADGYQLGLRDRVGHVARAGKDLANAAVPDSQHGTWQRTEQRGGDTFHIYETSDAGATAMAVQRRQRQAGYAST